jgi:preprotein translocase subunit SecG
MYNILLIVQILVALGIIGLVLVQHGKGADAGAAFGGGGAGGASGSVFGSRGAGNFLSRTTAILAVVFFINSLGLAWLVSHRSDGSSSSLVDSVAAPAVEQTVPAVANDVPDVPGSSTSEAKAEEGAIPEAPEAKSESSSVKAEAAVATPEPVEIPTAEAASTSSQIPASVSAEAPVAEAPESATKVQAAKVVAPVTDQVPVGTAETAAEAPKK